MAAELAELPTVPCIVRELTDDEAIIIMVDSNLQREQVLSAPVIKCKKTPRKKCSFVAEVKGKR